MLDQKLYKELNDQINAELHSSYLYLSMASWFESENLKGMAKWMHAQAEEENITELQITIQPYFYKTVIFST